MNCTLGRASVSSLIWTGGLVVLAGCGTSAYEARTTKTYSALKQQAAAREAAALEEAAQQEAAEAQAEPADAPAAGEPAGEPPAAAPTGPAAPSPPATRPRPKLVGQVGAGRPSPTQLARLKADNEERNARLNEIEVDNDPPITIYERELKGRVQMFRLPYTMRPPKDYQMIKNKDDDFGGWWVPEETSPKYRNGPHNIYYRFKPGEPEKTVKEIFPDRGGTPTKFTINGVTFWRRLHSDVRKNNREYFHAVYVGNDGSHEIRMHIECREPHNSHAFKLLEAAVWSLKKKPS